MAILLTGSVILSTLPTDKGYISSAQDDNISDGSIMLDHHVYHKGKGRLKKAARVKPMAELYSRLDMSAYKALGIKPPA